MLQAEIGNGKVTAAESLPTRGHLMPDFTMSSSDGRQVSLYDYRGRSNLVLFFAGRAQDSAEDPLLSALSKRYREITDTDSEALAVMADSVGQAEEFRRKMHFPFPVPSDPDMWVHNMGGRIKRMCKSIALLGEYTPTFPPHPATNAAIEHSRHLLGMDIAATWVSTKDVDPKLFEHYSGIWVAPGSPYKSMEKTLWAIRYARENNIPCFGTCGGFQHIVIEYARNVLGFKDAQHAEYDPYASSLFISQLTCSLAGREMRLSFVPGSRVATIYGGVSAKEQYYCNFGVNPDYINELKQGPLRITGLDAEAEIRVIEYPDHPFFIATLFVPQTRSTPESPHSLVTAFLEAVVGGQSGLRKSRGGRKPRLREQERQRLEKLLLEDS